MKKIHLNTLLVQDADAIVADAVEAILAQASESAIRAVTIVGYTDKVFSRWSNPTMRRAAAGIVACVDKAVIIVQPECLAVASKIVALRSGLTFAIEVGDRVVEIG